MKDRHRSRRRCWKPHTRSTPANLPLGMQVRLDKQQPLLDTAW